MLAPTSATHINRRLGVGLGISLAEFGNPQGCIKPVKTGNGGKERMRFVGTFLLD
jgi:hypothetical protein